MKIKPRDANKIAPTAVACGTVRCEEDPDRGHDINDTATSSQGRASATTQDRSSRCGSKTKPAKSGPKIQPATFTAYPIPARLGSPSEKRSTSFGVTNPRRPLNAAIPRGTRNCAGIPRRESAASKVIKETSHMNNQTRDPLPLCRLLGRRLQIR